MKIRLKLSYIFILINSIILSLPVAGIALMKLYDSTLIRQTENSLITQAVMLTSIYTKELQKNYPDLSFKNYGKALPKEYWQKDDPTLGKWRPIATTLDLINSPVYSKEVAPEVTKLKVDPIAWQLGLELESLLKEVQLTTLSGMHITDINGVIVSSTDEIKQKSLLNRPEVVNALNGKINRVIRKAAQQKDDHFFSPISRTSDIRIHVAYPITIEKKIIGAILLIRTPANIYQHIYQNIELFISYIILLIAIVLAISLFMAYAITRPIKALVVQAKKATATDGADNQLTVLNHPVTTEFEILSKALVKMSNKQTQRAEQIKNFASYVSHEFKTPITAIKGATEILQDHMSELSEKEQRQFLNNVAVNTKRMELLMRQLTELAKADTQKIPTTPCNLIKIIEQQSTLYKTKFIDITFKKTTNIMPVYMNNELLISIINNLFENVAQHGGDSIVITVVKKNQQCILTFSDNGKGISKHNAKRIFEPFFTTAKHDGGTGLGLAIISTLLTAHHGDIRLLQNLLGENQFDSTQNGCHFELIFPILS
jgi:signal transduction histidine kinase